MMLTMSAEDLKACGRRLYPAYVDYVQNVSPRTMAMSLESASFILWLAEHLEPASAVDFGSGFTSYVLRSVCDTVYSVDDSADWLQNTHTFLRRHHVQTDRLYQFDDYRQEQHSHDLVIYDFSSGEIRDANFSFAIGQLTPGGVGIMDDANHTSHREHMQQACDEHGRTLHSLHEWTTDEFMRYAALVT